MTKKLLVSTFEDNQRVFVSLALGFNCHLFGQLHENAVRKTQGKLKELPLIRGSIAYPNEFEFTLKTGRNTLHHIINQGTIETMQRAFDTVIGLAL
ncbi:hypothetical protein A343_1641 [Porphyromonas gingivalis JCVI SC001]|nr:hypothetical protein A343_1641 [Porphyromonas gingivalis JCVI SC001]